MNGDVDVESHSTSKKIKTSKDISNIEANCEDICDEIGITIANVDESVSNFRGDISIIYNDKAVQVNLVDLHVSDCERPARINGMLNHDVSPMKDGSLDDDECVVDESYKFGEHTIKEEPEDFEDMETYPNSMFLLFFHIVFDASSHNYKKNIRFFPSARYLNISADQIY